MRIENNYLKHERGHQGLRTAGTGTCFTALKGGAGDLSGFYQKSGGYLISLNFLL